MAAIAETRTRTQKLTDEDARWAAVVTRDKSADGAFVICVRTTGVYCRPGCPARTPKRENVTFVGDWQAAERAGFRECKRCRPKSHSRDAQLVALVAEACRQIEQAAALPTLSELARVAGLSASRFHRVFKGITGVTPRAYAGAVRSGRIQQKLKSSKSVTAAIYESGFESSGRFYESAAHEIGMTPTEYRRGGKGTRIRYAVGKSRLGRVLVGATECGVCAIFLGDDPKLLVRELEERFPQAELEPGNASFDRTVSAVIKLVERPEQAFNLPLDVRGTAFQRQVWEALRKIPAGTTTTYAELAARLGRPQAVRAVGAACGANPIAVAIPCHRVMRTDGSLAGYRWGLERKRALIEAER
ncbi:MAG: bifunctional DNA-binding transcriptional regulator/O6-methylguanine-DNA methyltransferase Ada [Planctomycetaceae bacterium]